MGALTELVKDVQVVAPEVPKFVVERQLLRASRDFLEFSRAWRVDIQVGVTDSTATTDITNLLPTNTELVDVISMKNSSGGQPVTATTTANLENNTSYRRNQEALDANWFLLEDNNILRFVYTPSTTVANKYYTRVAVKPTLSAAAVDDRVLNKYDETLVDGALGRLLAMPRKPWTDFALAEFYYVQFESEKQAARTEAAEEFQTGVPRKVKYGGL